MSGWWFKLWLIQFLSNHFWWFKYLCKHYIKSNKYTQNSVSWKLSREIFLHIDLYNHRKKEYLFVPVDFHIKTGSIIKSMLCIWLFGEVTGFVCLNLSRKGQKIMTLFFFFLSLTYFGCWSQPMTTIVLGNFFLFLLANKNMKLVYYMFVLSKPEHKQTSLIVWKVETKTNKYQLASQLKSHVLVNPVNMINKSVGMGLIHLSFISHNLYF